jgi:two-component system LytT family response regulator
MCLRVLIADDEPDARDRLRQLISQDRSLELVAECCTGREALDRIRSHAPHLVFLDVQMPELTGIEVLQELLPGPLPSVVFVTAYDHYAIEAFDFCAVDYILKPFDAARFRRAVQAARNAIDAKQREHVKMRDLVKTMANVSSPSDRIGVRSAGNIKLISFRDIDWIQGARNYAEIHVGKQVHFLRETLEALEERLPSREFIRVSKSAFVNVERIRELRPKSHGDSTVILRDGTQLTATRTYRVKLKQALGY